MTKESRDTLGAWTASIRRSLVVFMALLLSGVCERLPHEDAFVARLGITCPVDAADA
jgi:hypothetical protein